jgi:hypothetical protein
MNSEQYLQALRDGPLHQRLRFMAKEYDGPCGQSMTVQMAGKYKQDNLVAASALAMVCDSLQVEHQRLVQERLLLRCAITRAIASLGETFEEGMSNLGIAEDLYGALKATESSSEVST